MSEQGRKDIVPPFITRNAVEAVTYGMSAPNLGSGPLLHTAEYLSLPGISFSLLNIGGVMNSGEWGTCSLRLLVYTDLLF